MDKGAMIVIGFERQPALAFLEAASVLDPATSICRGDELLVCQMALVPPPELSSLGDELFHKILLFQTPPFDILQHGLLCPSHNQIQLLLLFPIIAKDLSLLLHPHPASL